MSRRLSRVKGGLSHEDKGPAGALRRAVTIRRLRRRGDHGADLRLPEGADREPVFLSAGRPFQRRGLCAGGLCTGLPLFRQRGDARRAGGCRRGAGIGCPSGAGADLSGVFRLSPAGADHHWRHRHQGQDHRGGGGLLRHEPHGPGLRRHRLQRGRLRREARGNQQYHTGELRADAAVSGHAGRGRPVCGDGGVLSGAGPPPGGRHHLRYGGVHQPLPGPHRHRGAPGLCPLPGQQEAAVRPAPTTRRRST